MTAPEPQVSWKAIERNAVVVAADGSEAAHVVEVAGDRTADIFSGLVVEAAPLQGKRFLPAEAVTAIWARRIEVGLTAEGLESLPAYEEPVVERLEETGGFLTRVRRLFR